MLKSVIWFTHFIYNPLYRLLRQAWHARFILNKHNLYNPFPLQDVCFFCSFLVPEEHVENWWWWWKICEYTDFTTGLYSIPRYTVSVSAELANSESRFNLLCSGLSLNTLKIEPQYSNIPMGLWPDREAFTESLKCFWPRPPSTWSLSLQLGSISTWEALFLSRLLSLALDVSASLIWSCTQCFILHAGSRFVVCPRFASLLCPAWGACVRILVCKAWFAVWRRSRLLRYRSVFGGVIPQGSM